MPDLDRPQQFYIALMKRWEEVPSLTAPELGLVTSLRKAAESSLESFDQMRRVARNSFFDVLWPAVVKARLAGISAE